MEIILALAITAIFSLVVIKTIENHKVHNELKEVDLAHQIEQDIGNQLEAKFKQAFDSLHAQSPKVYSWRILGKECERLTDEDRQADEEFAEKIWEELAKHEWQKVEQHLKKAVEEATRKGTDA